MGRLRELADDSGGDGNAFSARLLVDAWMQRDPDDEDSMALPFYRQMCREYRRQHETDLGPGHTDLPSNSLGYITAGWAYET